LINEQNLSKVNRVKMVRDSASKSTGEAVERGRQ
jgi:hypothetical protein